MKLTLSDFTPPRGTTKTVELTLAERKQIGREKLANYVLANFSVGTKVRLKDCHRVFILERFAGDQFIVSRRAADGWLKHEARLTYEEFVTFLAGTFYESSLLRIVKLILKNERDADSVLRKKMIIANRESRARILAGNYDLSDL